MNVTRGTLIQDNSKGVKWEWENWDCFLCFSSSFSRLQILCKILWKTLWFQVRTCLIIYLLYFGFSFSFFFFLFFFSFSFWFSILCNLNCKPFYYSLAFFSCNISFDFSWGTITMWSHWRLTLFEHYIFMACNIPRHAYLYFQSFLWQIFSLGF